MHNMPTFSWDEETGVAVCILSEGNNVFVGTACCCEEDKDMQSEKTGCQIALWRAEIKWYTHVRDNEIKPKLQALKQLYYSMNRSKNFNPKSYENKMLWRQIRPLEFDLIVVNTLLTETKEKLREYLDEKDKFYKRIRSHRKADLVGQN